MNLEQLIANLITAVEANTAAISGKVPAVAPGKPLAVTAAPAATTANTEAVTFDTLKPRFLALVNRNKEAAVALLTKFGLGKLSEAKLPQYPAIAEELKSAGV